MVPDRADTWTRMSYADANKPLAPIDDPYQMFNKLYGRSKDREVLASVLDIENAKYSTSYTMELMDPDVNACFRVRPTWVFGLSEGDFTGSPTKWEL